MVVTQTNDITDNLTYCIDNDLIPFLLKGKDDTLIITQDIMSELKVLCYMIQKSIKRVFFVL